MTFFVRLGLTVFLLSNTVACFDHDSNPRTSGKVTTSDKGAPATTAKSTSNAPDSSKSKFNGVRDCLGDNCSDRRLTCPRRGAAVNDPAPELVPINVNSRSNLDMAAIRKLLGPGQMVKQTGAANDTLVPSLTELLNNLAGTNQQANLARARQIKSVGVDFTSSPQRVVVNVELWTQSVSAPAVRSAKDATSPTKDAASSAKATTQASTGADKAAVTTADGTQKPTATTTATAVKANLPVQTMPLKFVGDLPEKTSEPIALVPDRAKVSAKLLCVDESGLSQIQDCQNLVVLIEWADATPAKTLTVVRMNTFENSDSKIKLTWPMDTVENPDMDRLGNFFEGTAEEVGSLDTLQMNSSETINGNAKMQIVFRGKRNELMSWKVPLIDLDLIPGQGGANLEVHTENDDKDLQSLTQGKTPDLKMAKSLERVVLVSSAGKGILVFNLVLSSLKDDKNDFIELSLERALSPVTDVTMISESLGLKANDSN